MKVLTEQTVRFRTGEILAPEELNRVFLYAQDAVADVAERRWAVGSITFAFVDTVASGLTNASAARLRTRRFACPVTCVVLRAHLSAGLTAGAAVAVNIYETGTTTPPSGATEPYLGTDVVTTPSEDTEDINVDKVLLEAGQVYDLVLSGTSFTTERFDVTLDVAIDRWQVGGSLDVPSFSPSLFIDEAPDAVKVAANQTALNTEAAKFAAAEGITPMLVWARNFLSTVDADLVTFSIPQTGATRAKAEIVRAYLTVAMNATTGGTVTAKVLDQSGSTMATITATMTGIDHLTVDSGALSIPLSGDPSDDGDDYRVFFDNSAAGNACLRAELVLWVRWGQ